MSGGIKRINILLIDDSPSDAFLITAELKDVEHFDFAVTHAETLTQGIELAQKGFDAILLDLSLPDSFGIKTYKDLRGIIAATPIIILTNLHNAEAAAEALGTGKDNYVLKERATGMRLANSILASLL